MPNITTPFQGSDGATRANFNQKIADINAHGNDAVAHVTQTDHDKISEAVPSTRKINNKPLSSDISLTKADVGLGNVENTADANKNVYLSNYSHYSSHAVASGGSALRNITMSTAGPSGGQDGDVWMQYT